MCYQQGPAEKVQRWIAWVIQAGYKEQLDSAWAEDGRRVLDFLDGWEMLGDVGSVWFGITQIAHARLTIATAFHDHQRIENPRVLSRSWASCWRKAVAA